MKNLLSSTKTSFLYIIGNIEHSIFKIGYSKNPYHRIKNLQTGNPIPLKVLWSQELNEQNIKFLEKEVHKLLSYKRTNGEWFNENVENIIKDLKYLIIKHDLV